MVLNLEQLAEKHSIAKPSAPAADKAFEDEKYEHKQTTKSERNKARQVVGQRPNISTEDELNNEFAVAQFELSDLADDLGVYKAKYGKLAGIFAKSDKKALLTRGEHLKYWWHNARGHKKKKKEIISKAITSNTSKIGSVADMICENITETYNIAEKNKELKKEQLEGIVGHIKFLNEELSGRLKGGLGGNKELVKYEVVLKEIDAGLQDFSDTIAAYEKDIVKARNEDDAKTFNKLTGELDQLIVMQADYLDNKLETEGFVSSSRSELVDLARGVISAKENIDQAWVNYRTSTMQYDAMCEIASMYKYMQSDMLLNMQHTTQNAVDGMGAKDMLSKIDAFAGVMDSLTEFNVKLTEYIAEVSFEKVQKELTSREKSAKRYAQLTERQKDLNRRKDAWVQHKANAGDAYSNLHGEENFQTPQ